MKEECSENLKSRKLSQKTLLFCLLILQVGKLIHRKFEYLLSHTVRQSTLEPVQSFESKAMFLLLSYIIWRLQEYYCKTLDY